MIIFEQLNYETGPCNTPASDATRRITVEHILRCLGAGDTVEEIIESHPHLTGEDIRAAQNYAADYLSREGLIAAE